MHRRLRRVVIALRLRPVDDEAGHRPDIDDAPPPRRQHVPPESARAPEAAVEVHIEHIQPMLVGDILGGGFAARRSEEHTSELQSLMRISYAVFCLKKNN